MTTDVRPPDDTRRRRPLADLPLVVMLALVLDVWRPLPAWGGFPWRWLDVVAASALIACAWWQRRPDRRVSVATPLDMNFLAMIVLGMVMAVPESGRAEAFTWMHVGLSCLALYFVTVVSARSEQRLPSLGPAIAVAVLAPASHALWRATAGLDALAADSAIVDVAWGARHGAFKLLLIALPLAVGRASEPGAPPFWRGVVLVGAVGLGLQVAATGSGLAATAFVRLADPLFFSNLVVSMLVVLTILRMAMHLGQSEPSQRFRWRSIAASFGALAVLAVLGEVTAGAGVRALAALVAGTVIAAAEEPGRSESEDLPAPMELDRAA